MFDPAVFSLGNYKAVLLRIVELFSKADLCEASSAVYKLLLPIYEREAEHLAIAAAYQNMHEMFFRIGKDDRRMLGNYYRVACYGKPFGKEDGVEYVYKERLLARLADVCERLVGIFEQSFGAGKVVIWRESGEVDRAKLPCASDDSIAVLQITFAKPYFENESVPRTTFFSKSFNVQKFMFETPFSKKRSKAHAESLSDQWKFKTILTVDGYFPSIRTRLRVARKEQIELTPIEACCEILEKQTRRIANEVTQCENAKLSSQEIDVMHYKSLMGVLQGTLLLQVQAGPKAIAEEFLVEPDEGSERNQAALLQMKKQYHSLLASLEEALHLSVKHLVQQRSSELMQELQTAFGDLEDFLRPLVKLE